jgi:hypothetical protein
MFSDVDLGATTQCLLPRGHLAQSCFLVQARIPGSSLDRLTARASEAIQIWWKAMREDWPPAGLIREIDVELPL